MKIKYSTPVIEVEELFKHDVLCSSTPATENPDNIQQSLLDFDSWMDD